MEDTVIRIVHDYVYCSGEYQNRFYTVYLPHPYATSVDDGQPPCLNAAETGKLRHKAAK